MLQALEGIRQKIYRAHHHLRALDQAHRDFLYSRSPPYESFDTFENVEAIEDGKFRAQHVTTARVHKPPPLSLGVIMGDVLHNAHSALDQITCQLVLLNGRQPTNATAFPIFSTFEEFRCEGFRLLRGASEEILVVMESIQPYHGTKWTKDVTRHPLYILKELSRRDKHHVLIPALTIPMKIEIIPRYGVESVGRQHRHHGPIEDGDEIVRADVVLTVPPPEAELDTRLTVGIGLRERGFPLWMMAEARGIVGSVGNFVIIAAREYFGIEWEPFPPVNPPEAQSEPPS